MDVGVFSTGKLRKEVLRIREQRISGRNIETVRSYAIVPCSILERK